MTKLVTILNSSSDPNKTAFMVHQILGVSVSQALSAINSSSPIAEFVLFQNDFEIKAKQIRDLILKNNELGSLHFFELDDDDNFISINDNDKYEISAQTVENILSSFENEVERQERMGEY